VSSRADGGLASALSAGAAVLGVEVFADPADSADSAGRRIPPNARILIIGINYRPEPTGIAPYTAAMADHLGRQAGSVTVLTGLPHYPAWEVPYVYRRQLRRRELVADGTVLVRHAHYVPRRQSALTRATYEMTFMANVVTSPVRQRPDLVLAISPSLGGAVAGATIARRYRAPLVTVIQDLMAKAADQSGMAGGSSVSGMTARIEKAAIRRSRLVAVVSEAFRQQVVDYGVDSDRVRLLPNWTHIRPAETSREAARQQLGWPRDRFIVLHSGNMGLKQDLGNVVDAATALRGEPGVSFYLVGNGSQRAFLRNRADGLANVTFVDPLADDEYPLALAAADVLLVNERASVTDMSLPSKLTSYLAAGRPVLAAVADHGATARELATTDGAALIVKPGLPAALADAVRLLAGNDLLRADLARRGERFAREHLTPASAMRRVTSLVAEALEPA
jgi:colanic acid biosynthesis glycosyl transferase WcaI